MQLGFPAQKVFGRSFDTGEVTEVEFEEVQLTFGRWISRLERVDGGLGLGFRACGDIYSAIARVEDFSDLVPDTGVGACDDEYLDGARPLSVTASPMHGKRKAFLIYLAALIREILLCQRRLWNTERLTKKSAEFVAHGVGCNM